MGERFQDKAALVGAPMGNDQAQLIESGCRLYAEEPVGTAPLAEGRQQNS